MTAVVPPQATVQGALGLGLDAGGTRTRWALADATGAVKAQGEVAGLTALMMGSEAGRAKMAAVLEQLAHELRANGFATAFPKDLQTPGPARVVAGFSGYSEDPPLRAGLESLLAAALELPATQVRLLGDIALAYLDCFAPGAGYLVYAGTGSIAAYVDTDGRMHRAGGRGGLLDDGGSGYWIAREAMRQVWRAEDESPGSWRASRLALAMFEHIGSSEWARSRDFIYQGTRGQVGELALAVAAAARDGDAAALALLQQAGIELARLGRALARRFGDKPMALAGRALELHPAIEHAMRAALAPTAELRLATLRAHETAARLAACDDPVLHRLADAPADDFPVPSHQP